jgi:phage terminase large subunit
LIVTPELLQLTDTEKEKFLFLAQQKELERVSPKLEQFRNSKYRINIAYGGRGAGSKSWSFDSLMIQRAHREKLRIACFREIQVSLKESSYQNIVEQIARLRYPGWKIQNESIKSPSGSYIIFKGLKDIRAAQQTKSYEGFDIFRIEEGSAISADSLSFLLPTLRKIGSQFWITLNQETENDPVMEMFVNAKRSDCLAVFCEPEGIDNPWWNETVLAAESEELKKRNPDEWLYVYGGQPRAQGQNAVMSRALIDQAMKREIESDGQEVVGCDPADFGDDKTQIYVRKGLKVIQHRELTKMDGIFIANEIGQMIDMNREIQINLDSTGIGTSTRDQLKYLKLNVNAINFAQSPNNKKKYHDFNSELWFNFKNEFLDKGQIPNDNELRQELGGRLYKYDHENRYQVEPKGEFKKRLKRSPDKADALLLCFYNPNKVFDAGFRKRMAVRDSSGYRYEG